MERLLCDQRFEPKRHNEKQRLYTHCQDLNLVDLMLSTLLPAEIYYGCRQKTNNNNIFKVQIVWGLRMDAHLIAFEQAKRWRAQ